MEKFTKQTNEITRSIVIKKEREIFCFNFFNWSNWQLKAKKGKAVLAANS